MTLWMSSRLTAIGQERLSDRHEGQCQFAHDHRRQGQEAVVPGVNDGFEVANVPCWTSHSKRNDRFVGGVDDALDQPALRTELPPKL